MKKLKVAVTGGIGSGKTSLCSLFESRGYAVLSSDEIAKEIMHKDAGVKKMIVKNFGAGAYRDNSLNKEYLAKQIFTDPEKTALINSIVHPATIKELQQRMKKELSAKEIVFVESALVYEAKMNKFFDYVILVLTGDEEKINRVVKRDNVKPGLVVERMNNQIPDEKKKERADFVINNNSTLEEFNKRGEFILKIIESISKGE